MHCRTDMAELVGYTENGEESSEYMTKTTNNLMSTSARNGTITTTLKRNDYLSWEDYFMGVAHMAALRSKDPVMQVGAVIVNKDKRIVGSGYNGMPIGCSDDLLPWSKGSEDFLSTKYAYVCHAEMNAILNKITCSIKGSTIYTVLFPCNECAKLIIQAGISEVVFHYEKPDKVETIASKRMLDMAGVRRRQFHSNRKIQIDLSCNSSCDIITALS